MSYSDFPKSDKLLLIYLRLAISLKITTPMISGFENKVIPNLECQGGKCVEGPAVLCVMSDAYGISLKLFRTIIHLNKINL